MNILNCLRPLRKAAVVSAMCLACIARADILYQLEPGSTITPGSIGQPSGPSEPLTGTFTWQLGELGPNSGAFYETSLTLQSPSFLLTLDTTHNNLGTSIFPATQTSYFAAVVDGSGVGLPASPLEIASFGLGSYEGPSVSPTRLLYSELYLAPYAGGGILATISFEAMQVPEPKALALASVGLALLAGRRLRPWIA
jgi:hypothetical protein